MAVIHEMAWKEGFRGILSDDLLNDFGGSGLIESWGRTIRRGDRRNVVAEIEPDRKVVAFCGFEIAPDSTGYGEIVVMHVHPGQWRKGIGSGILEYACRQLTESRAEAVYLWTMSENLRARSFYESQGFRLTGDSRVSQVREESFEEVKYLR